MLSRRYHVEVFHLAREALLREGIAVVGGFLGPSSDAWVVGKLGASQALPLPRRARLCELACAGSDLVATVPWAEPSSPRMARRLGDALARWGVRGMVLAGSDAARIALAAASSGAVCVRRAGGPPLDPAVLARARETAVPGGLGLHVVDGPVGAVAGFDGAVFSSTRARELIKAGLWEELRAEGLLHEAVVQQLADWRDQDPSNPLWAP